MVICAIKRSVLLSIFAYYAIVTACPVHKSCSCEERPDGYYIDCNNPTDASLNDIVQSLGKRRVQRLKITNATYPVSFFQAFSLSFNEKQSATDYIQKSEHPCRL